MVSPCRQFKDTHSNGVRSIATGENDHREDKAGRGGGQRIQGLGRRRTREALQDPGGRAELAAYKYLRYVLVGGE